MARGEMDESTQQSHVEVSAERSSPFFPCFVGIFIGSKGNSLSSAG